MRSVLESLKEYQDVLSRIAELDRLLSEVPPEIQDLEKEWQSIKERIEKLEARKAEQSTQLREKTNALEDANAKAKKFEADLQEVTNTREYHAALKEIDGAKKLIHTLKDAVASRQSELEEIERNMEECTQLESESKSKFDTEMAGHKESMMHYQQEHKEKSTIMGAVGGNIPDKLMSQFKRIAKRRNGVGLAVCSNGICTACNVRVRQNVVDELRKHNRIWSCESCKRILYFDGE